MHRRVHDQALVITQKAVALSSAEAELYAATRDLIEARGLNSLGQEFVGTRSRAQAADMGPYRLYDACAGENRDTLRVLACVAGRKQKNPGHGGGRTGAALLAVGVRAGARGGGRARRRAGAPARGHVGLAGAGV